MPCYKPLTAYKPLDGGALVFSERKNCRTVTIRCGSCIGCRLIRQNSWSLRILFESQMHATSYFLTLTYRDECVPPGGTLDYSDVQLFLRRLRRRVGKVRFFCTAEYGGQFGRPHYHLMLFGLKLDDLERINSARSKQPIFRSALIEECWPQGHSSLGFVTLASARYCAKYAVDKVTGSRADVHYTRVNDETGEVWQVKPEFARMSLKPGIGFSWFERYWRDILLAGDGAVVLPAGKRVSCPEYFRRVADRVADLPPGIVTSLQSKAMLDALDRAWDSTPERLAVREQCTLARIAFNAER